MTVLIWFTGSCLSGESVSLAVAEKYQVKNIQTVKEFGKSVDWSVRYNLILSASRSQGGYYDIFVMRPDGSNLQYLTRNTADCPQKHNGNPVWHPEENSIVFTAEKEGTPLEMDNWAIPGKGINCNLWAMDTCGETFFPLTSYPDSFPPVGVIHPQFSHSGRKLLWAERRFYGDSFGGGWILKLADFNFDSGCPYLSNIEILLPGEQSCFYESHGFSADDRRILFSGNLLSGQVSIGLDIYELDLESGELIRLTESFTDWDEHAHYSPDNKKIAWMSSTDFDIIWGDILGDGWQKYLITELWLMNSNGSGKQRITHFNTPGYPEYLQGRRVIVSDSSWSPDGKKLVACLAYSSLTNREQITGSRLVIIEFE